MTELLALLAGPARAELPPEERRLAVVLAGNHGTEITDLLPPAEVLAASGAFEVVVVAPTSGRTPLTNGLLGDAGVDLDVPVGVDDWDARYGRTPDLVVVPYLPRGLHEDAAVVPWLKRQIDAGATVLSICRGAETLAATGALDGRVATSYHGWVDRLARRYPDVRWTTGRRYAAADGSLWSSANLATGVDGTLAVVAALAGEAAAARAWTELGYAPVADPGPFVQPDVPLSAVARFLSPRPRRDRAMLLEDGVSDTLVAAVLDGWALAGRTRTVTASATGAPVVTRAGLVLHPRGALSEVRAGGWVTTSPRPELPDAVVLGAERPAPAAVVRALAEERGPRAATFVAEQLSYPEGTVPR